MFITVFYEKEIRLKIIKDSLFSLNVFACTIGGIWDHLRGYYLNALMYCIRKNIELEYHTFGFMNITLSEAAFEM